MTMKIMHEQEYYENYGSKGAHAYIEENILDNAEEIKRFQTVVEEIKDRFSKEIDVLDIGCGNGVLLKILRESYPNANLIGFERSVEMLSAAREKFGVNIIQGSADLLPFPEASFNVVTALEVIEHLPEKCYRKALEEMERVAKDIIIITVPYKEVRRFVQCPSCKTKFSPIFHLRTFDESQLANLFSRYGLVKTCVIKKPLPAHYTLRTKWKNFLGSHEFPETAICPACGVKGSDLIAQEDENNKIEVKTSTKLMSMVKGYIPEIPQNLWILAVYKPYDHST